MGEFDLDLRVGGDTYGWESVFRPKGTGAPGIVRMSASSNDPEGCLGCTPYTDTCAMTCGGLTGSPCAC